MKPQANEIYKHFKGNLYKVISLAIHSETEEEMVVYQALYGDYKIYCRPLDSFISDVDQDKYPEASQKKRFELISAVVPTQAPVDVSDTVASDLTGDFTNENTCNEDANLNPLVEQFLDAPSMEEKIDLLSRMKTSCTQHDLTIIATIMDIELDASLEYDERYRQLMNYLKTRSRFETLRLR